MASTDVDCRQILEAALASLEAKGEAPAAGGGRAAASPAEATKGGTVAGSKGSAETEVKTVGSPVVQPKKAKTLSYFKGIGIFFIVAAVFMLLIWGLVVQKSSDSTTCCTYYTVLQEMSLFLIIAALTLGVVAAIMKATKSGSFGISTIIASLLVFIIAAIMYGLLWAMTPSCSLKCSSTDTRYVIVSVSVSFLAIGIVLLMSGFLA